MRSKERTAPSLKVTLLLLMIILVAVAILVSTSSSEAQSEDGVIVVKGTYDNGFASMEWDRFIPAQIPGDPYCIRYQAASKTLEFSESPNFDMVLDLGQGIFSGSVNGNVQAKEFGWKTTGSYNLTGISGTIKRVNDDGFGDWELSGTGEATLQFYEEANCPAEDAQGQPIRVIASRSETITVPVEVTGRIGTIFISGQTDAWVWRPRFTYASEEVRFSMTCFDCEIGVWTPSDEFSVNLDCQPVSPQEEDPVNCRARVLNVEQGEELEYTWYVDSAKQTDTRVPTWTWPSAEKGVHDITVYVQGEGRNVETTVTLEVGEEAELVASIGMDPPVPVLEKAVTFTPRVEGAKANEALSYRWQLDGQILCVTEMCVWGEALEGGHEMMLEVSGEGERISVAQRQFKVVTLVNEETAGFRIVMLGCNSGVSSDDTLTCTLGLERDEGVGALNVTWFIDGVVASTEPGVQAGSEMNLAQPAPGDHAVEAVVVDPEKGKAISGQTAAEVIAGQNALIPPQAQAGAAGGTLAVVGAWLWAEWLNARRAEAEEAQLREQQKPYWVEDKRSLKEIWAAEAEAERQRRGLWGFEYDDKAGVFKEPDWAQGLTGVQREDVLSSKEIPWWWGEAEEEWERQRQAVLEAKLRADRSFEDEWLQEIASESSVAERQRSGWIYNPDIDAWEKASWHPDEIAKRIRERMLKTDRAIDSILDELPVSQWGKVEALQEKLLASGEAGIEDLSRMLRLRRAVYNLREGQYDREAAAALHDAAWMQFGEQAASNIRTGAMGASIAISLSPLVLGVAGWATGAASLTNAAAAVSGAMAQLGAFRLTMNLVEGATVGYLEGGMSGAVVGGMRKTLPINTMALWLGPRAPGYEGPGWKQIGASLFQDFGNAVTLNRGIAQFKQLAQRAGTSISNAYQRLTGNVQQTLRTPPVRSSVLLKQDAEWWAQREQGQQLVNEFNQTLRKMNATTDRILRAQLSNQLSKQAVQINQNYAAKSIMKVIQRPSLTKAFDQRIQRIYRVVDRQVVKELNAAGFTRGGQPLTRADLVNFRNASSYGTVGMDRDVGLNEMLVKQWEGVVNQATPGTAWHAHAIAKLREAQQASRLAEGGQSISLSNFNDRFQKIYEGAYRSVTGGDPKLAFQTATTSGNVEAYKDLNVLQNNPLETPFSSQWAGQTGSVSAVKVHENFKMVSEGILSKGNAIQESARGLSKDIATKLVPLLKTNPGASSAQIQYWQSIQHVLGEAGKGNVTPGQLLQVLGTDESGIVRMAEQVSAGIQSAAQFR
jgi:hypothetical protein